MKRLAAIATLALAAAVHAQNPQDFGGYTSMRIDFVGFMQGDYQTGALEKFTDGVKITLLSDDPNQKPVPISANTMTFQYAEGQSMPTVITMEGQVQIDHPQASIRAGRAEWNFESGDLVFTGSPVMKSDRFKEMRGEKMRMNFKTGAFEVSQAKIDEIPLEQSGTGSSGAPSNPNLLSESDVTDWPGLIQALKNESASSAPSPGRLLVSLLPGTLREAVQGMSVETLVGQKGKVLGELNKILQTQNLYDPTAFGGVTLDDEAKALAAKSDRSDEERIRLNRLLLQAAYPAMIAKK
ncbi:MAG: hypothetical protein IT368_09270 [Candidatus Hydrogenedentes bacterium]|nr:hypothetical protein [Candidatus Hydrogenedentota bacterium]